ncbi:MAG: FAD-binding oxidoreductase [Actinobacteria bacterium]|nr:FAD-binding oxidoreductase [Actinomycetota bacterium]
MHSEVPTFSPPLVAQSDLQGPLPKEVDVLIVGGGLLGSALAYYLSVRGTEVLLVERGELNREALGTNAGSFHFQIALHQLTASSSPEEEKRLYREVKLQLDAARLWGELEKELDADLGVHTTGGLMVAETEEELKVLRDKQRIEEMAGLETHVMTGSEMTNFAPYLSSELAGIAYCPQEGHANPLVVAPTYIQRAHERGAQIRTHCGVDAIEVLDNQNPYRFEVKTSRGSVKCRRIVDAAGAWTGDIAHMVGLRLPMGSEGLHVNVTEPAEYFLKPMVQHIGKRLTLKQTSNNTFIIGGGWPARKEIYPKRYSNFWDSAAGNIAIAVRVLPMLRNVKLVRTWAGIWSYTKDFAPLVGESALVPGFHVAMAPTGFTLGPMIANLLAESMTSESKAELIPAAYLPDRGM